MERWLRDFLQAKLNAGTPQGLGEDECWPFIGTTFGQYGKIAYGPKRKRVLVNAARVLLALKGDLPLHGAEFHARHTCDNPPCINPKHIIPGTPKQNTDDMLARGRHRYVGNSGGWVRTGKLTDEQVLAIRRDDRIHRLIAADYGVRRETIVKIKNRTRKGNLR